MVLHDAQIFFNQAHACIGWRELKNHNVVVLTSDSNYIENIYRNSFTLQQIS